MLLNKDDIKALNNIQVVLNSIIEKVNTPATSKAVVDVAPVKKVDVNVGKPQNTTKKELPVNTKVVVTPEIVECMYTSTLNKHPEIEPKTLKLKNVENTLKQMYGNDEKAVQNALKTLEATGQFVGSYKTFTRVKK